MHSLVRFWTSEFAGMFLKGEVKKKEKYTLLKFLIIWFLEGQEIGYIRIGLLAIRGTLEVEIIRGIILLIPGDHPPGKKIVQICLRLF